MKQNLRFGMVLSRLAVLKRGYQRGNLPKLLTFPRMESLTERLRTKLELTYDGIWDTPHSFQYLTRFQIFLNAVSFLPQV